MSEKTKNQHYVPRVYLRRFCYDGEHIHLYDKMKDEIRRKQAVDNVAAERFFYDIDLAALFNSMDENQKAEYPDINIEQFDSQYIEHKFGRTIEASYETLIGPIIDRAEKRTMWELKNCFAINDEEKLILALYITSQLLRSKSFREYIIDSRKAIGKLITEIAHSKLDVPDDIEVTLSNDKQAVAFQHGDLLLDEKVIFKCASKLANHYWMILYNNTSTPFFTSDNPVALIPHKYDDFINYSGFGSEGIEIFFPLSPKIAIVMYERTFHKCMSQYENWYIAVSKSNIIDEYNIIELRNSLRNVFSICDDFSICVAACANDPTILVRNKVEVFFGGKKIY